MPRNDRSFFLGGKSSRRECILKAPFGLRITRSNQNSKSGLGKTQRFNARIGPKANSRFICNCLERNPLGFEHFFPPLLLNGQSCSFVSRNKGGILVFRGYRVNILNPFLVTEFGRTIKFARSRSSRLFQ